MDIYFGELKCSQFEIKVDNGDSARKSLLPEELRADFKQKRTATRIGSFKLVASIGEPVLPALPAGRLQIEGEVL